MKMNFGKYKGYSIGYIITKRDFAYLKYLLSNHKMGRKVYSENDTSFDVHKYVQWNCFLVSDDQSWGS
tara:strand:- start:2310 stop:2513 length:204 start_codon:yes stop_codon:yes gene_type:complete